MNDIINVPTSIRQHMESAMSLVQQQKPVQASVLVGSALTELAKSQPDVFGALVAAKLGVRQITIETRELIPVERKPINRDWELALLLFPQQPTHTERITTKTIRIW